MSGLRALGPSGLEVPPVGFGCLSISGSLGPCDEAGALRALRHAIDGGTDGRALLDCADFYGAGRIEELVGRACAGRRDDAVLATRGGVLCTPEGRPAGVDGSPEHLRRAVHGSLRRLGVDRIDLYTLGRVDPDVPVAESVGALAAMVAEGKIAHIGLSEVEPEQLLEAAAVHPIAAVAAEYAIWTREVESGILPAARTVGTGLIATSPLGRGILAGWVAPTGGPGAGDLRGNHPRLGEHLDANRRVVAPLFALAERLRVSPAQLALAWVLHRGPDVALVTGSRSPGHISANRAAADLALDPAVVGELDEAVDWMAVTGDRLPRRPAPAPV